MDYSSKQLNFRVFLKTENSIFLDSPVDFDCQAYFEAILTIVNFSDIVFVGNVLNSKYVVQFFTRELADYVVTNYPCLNICNTTVTVRPFSADCLGYDLPKGNVEIDATYCVTKNTKIEVNGNLSGVAQNMPNATNPTMSPKDTYIKLNSTQDTNVTVQTESTDQSKCRFNGNKDNFISPNMTFSLKSYQQTNQSSDEIFTFNATSTIISSQNAVQEHSRFIHKRIIASSNRDFGNRNGPRRHIPIRGIETLMAPNLTRGIRTYFNSHSLRSNETVISPINSANFKRSMSMPIITENIVGPLSTTTANLCDSTHSLACKMEAASIHASTDQQYSLNTQNYKSFFNSLYIDFQIIRNIIENPYSCFPFSFDEFIEFLADSYTMPTLEALAVKYSISILALKCLMKNIYAFLPNETVRRIFSRFVNLDKP